MDKTALTQPALIAHADWSKTPSKRWCSVAVLVDDGKYRATAPEQVGDVSTFFERLLHRANGGGVFAGFDFPIGLPVAFAKRARIKDFREVLRRFGHRRWKDFYEPATSIDEISTTRPFYPAGKSKGKKKSSLTEKLRVADTTNLLRRCEVGHAHRSNAEILFWLVGAKQVGRAAINGWKELIVPALEREPSPVIWPFDGCLTDLIERRGITIAETYPSEFYGHLGLSVGKSSQSKTCQHTRAGDAQALLRWARKRSTHVRIDKPLREAIKDGFGSDKSGEDRFDAVVGLFGMIDVVIGELTEGVPSDPEIRNVEGWILGRQSQN